MALEVGTRVVRGPDWKFKDQDNGEGYLGTVISIGKKSGKTNHEDVVTVLWDMKEEAYMYHAGYENKFDLLVFDNAPAGVTHGGVTCNSCKDNDIPGVRWKCSECYNYDLCSKCYISGQHDLQHTFLRVVLPGSVSKLMSSREGAKQVQAKGMFTGATVCRGRDWQWKNQDGGEGKTGTVVRRTDWANLKRSGVTVRWGNGASYNYRAGHGGKVDVRCVTAKGGGNYFRDHLPKLGLVDIFKVGDRVAVKIEKGQLQSMQEDFGVWRAGMEKCIGKVGSVCVINPGGNIQIEYSDGQKWVFNSLAVSKLPSFKIGGKVIIMSDTEKVKDLQKGHGGWSGQMAKALGKEGHVLSVTEDGDVKVNVAGQTLTFNPDALTPKDEQIDLTKLSQQDVQDHLVQLFKPLLTPLGMDTFDVRQFVADAVKDVREDPMAFWRAVYEGDVDEVAKCLTVRKDLVNANLEGITPLHLGCCIGNLQVVDLLVKSGAKLDVIDSKGNTPLIIAVSCDKPQIMKVLLDHGANPNVVMANGSHTAVQAASYLNHIDCAKVLVQKGCTVNNQDSVGDTALHDAVREGHDEITELLLRVGNIDVLVKNKKGLNPLHTAALAGNAHATRLLVKKRPTLVNVCEDDENSALHLAVINNQGDVVHLLLTEGKCSVNMYNKHHHTALILAVARGRTLIVKDLMDHGADSNSVDSDGDSCLHLAVMKHRRKQTIPDSAYLKKIRERYRGKGITAPLTAMMCFLVQRGADVNLANTKKLTPLNYIKEDSVRKVLEEVARNRESHPDGDCGAKGETDVRESEVTDPPQEDSFSGVHIIGDPDKEVKLGQVIGRGGFGEVRKGQWRGTRVAVKLLVTIGSKKEDVYKEISIHKRALHPTIVQLMAVGYKENEALVVMQYIDGKNLNDVIFEDGNPLKFEEKVRISRDVLSAVTYLHHCRILHLDIKPPNILLEKVGKKPYLCDLGIAHIKTRCSMSQSSHLDPRGTLLYIPPEALQLDGMHATAACDVWSLACTVLELFTGESVWPKTLGQQGLIIRLMKPDVTPMGVQKLDGKIKEILKPCFQKNPSKRPSAETMMQEFSGLI